MIIPPDTEQALTAVFEHWEAEQNPAFGNGRDVRKLLDTLCTRQNNRLAEQEYAADEALYTLLPEDIPENLLAYMENYRDRLCVIAAGYPKLMEKFLYSNPGLPSRFAGTIHFEDYDAHEMLEIFRLMADRNRLIIGDDVEERVLEIFSRWEAEKSDTFGNGREVRKLLDAVCTRQNNRLVDQGITDKKLLYRLEVKDI